MTRQPWACSTKNVNTPAENILAELNSGVDHARQCTIIEETQINALPKRTKATKERASAPTKKVFANDK
jgi:hypothetical protein